MEPTTQPTVDNNDDARPKVRFPSPRMTTCCCCIKLKPAAWCISFIWMIWALYEGILFVLSYSNGIKFGGNFLSYLDTSYSLATAILSFIILIGSLYGLFVLSCANVYRLLRIYVVVAYIITFLYSFLAVFEFVLVLVSRQGFLDDCINAEDQSAHDDCTTAYNLLLPGTITAGIITIILSIYFAMVIHAYGNQRREKEERLVDAQMQMISVS